MQVIRSFRLLYLVAISILVIVAVLALSVHSSEHNAPNADRPVGNSEYEWTAPGMYTSNAAGDPELIYYGRDLIANTASYLGPKGKVAAITNGMNCQNCHLNAGTKRWGNNYSAVFSTYPRFRERSGTVENIYKRVNDCIERSLNGSRTLDTNSREMLAFAAYINWLGKDVPRETRPKGVGIADIPFLDRAADPVQGRSVYILNCQRCHGQNGEGVWNDIAGKFDYPPLWGENSYTTAAGLYRISRFAGFVRYNMPLDAPHNSRSLTDEEAWDVAAFVNSQPRPVKVFKQDWPKIAGKPIDHPFGPYADEFSEQQHKYGPFWSMRKKY
jgi:thiosulfate dehydrogenase